MEPMHIRSHLRTLLGSASLLTACLAGSACIEGVDEVPEEEILGEQEQAAAASKPGASNFALELDGVSAGFVTSAAGGVSVVEVSATPVGASMKKQVSALSIEPIRMEMGFATFSGMQDWVAATWNGKVQRKSGLVGSTAFEDATINEIVFPALDAGSAGKDTAKFGVVLSPTHVDDVDVAASAPRAQKEQALGFRFRLGDLPSTRVSRIDSFTVKAPSAAPIGEIRDVKEGGAIDFPDLKVTFSAADVKPWREYMQKVLSDGEIDEKEELSGSIEFLSGNKVVATLSLQHVGIKRLALAATASADEVQRYQADLYVEKMSFESNGK